MTLTIEYRNGVLDEFFARWMVGQIQQKMLMDVNPTKLTSWDEYLNSGEEFEIINVKKVSSKEIVLNGIRHLVYELSPNKITIHIDRNQNVFGFNNTKLETVCRLINYGNTSMRGYPIFSSTFIEVSENIGKYIDRYVLMGI